LKSKVEDQEKKAPSQEDESVRPHDLEIIHPTSQPKPKNTFKLFFLLSVDTFDLAILSIHIKSTS
jgi:hypothetical protein